MKAPDVINGIQRWDLASWKDYSEVIDYHHSNCPPFIYRGQASAWPVESSLDRHQRQIEKGLRGPLGEEGRHPPFADQFRDPANRRTHLRRFKEAVRGRRGPHPLNNLDEDEWWALAQHHGLKTPMLDWTYSPFVALFFAFEEECVICGKHGDKYESPEKRAVYTVSSSCIDQPSDQHHPAPKPYVSPRDTSPRLLNQAGLFLNMPEDCDLEKYVSEHWFGDNSNRVLQVIMIPNNDRRDCLKLLNKMNINRASLFPDLDGAARYVNDLWELRFDSPIGHLWPDEGK